MRVLSCKWLFLSLMATSALHGQPGPPASDETNTVVLASVVVAAQDVTFTAMNASGAIEGLVLDVNGKRTTTGPRGLVTALVPADASKFTVSFAGSRGSASARVVPPSTGSTQIPAITSATAYPTPGGQLGIGGKGFSGTGSENQVKIGSRSLNVLSSSPVEIIAAVPHDMPLGTGPLTAATATGTSAPREVAVVRLRVEGSNKTLIRGQKGRGRVIIEGTKDRVIVKITNGSPGVVALSGGQASMTPKSSGGAVNVVSVPYTAVGAGAFLLKTEIVPPVATASKGK